MDQGHVVDAYKTWAEADRMSDWGNQLNRNTKRFTVIVALILALRLILVGIIALSQLLVLRIEKSDATSSPEPDRDLVLNK